MKQWYQEWIHAPLKNFLSWGWVKQFLYWLIVSAGTMSECAFLLASLWMSLNSTVHGLILMFMDEKQAIHMSYFATAIFTGLPEVILGLSLLTTINHCKDIRWDKRYWHTWVWPILFGIPTLVFLVLSIITVSCSVLRVNYTMPDWGIVARALAGFGFAIVFFLYEQMGKPCYAKERKALEQTIADLEVERDRNKQRFETALNTANENFQMALSAKQSEFEYRLNEIVEQGKSQIGHLQNLLEAKNMQVQKLSERASSLVSQGLENYPKFVEELVTKGVKTVHIDTLSELTGISKRRIASAKSLQRHSRNKDLIMVNSAIEWLQKQPLPEVTIVSKESEDLPESEHIAKIIEFHLPSVYPQNGA